MQQQEQKQREEEEERRKEQELAKRDKNKFLKKIWAEFSEYKDLIMTTSKKLESHHIFPYSYKEEILQLQEEVMQRFHFRSNDQHYVLPKLILSCQSRRL